LEKQEIRRSLFEVCEVAIHLKIANIDVEGLLLIRQQLHRESLSNGDRDRQQKQNRV
jgi:hypothetical protein